MRILRWPSINIYSLGRGCILAQQLTLNGLLQRRAPAESEKKSKENTNMHLRDGTDGGHNIEWQNGKMKKILKLCSLQHRNECLRPALEKARSPHCTEWNCKLTRKGSGTVQMSSNWPGRDAQLQSYTQLLALCLTPINLILQRHPKPYHTCAPFKIQQFRMYAFSQ